MRAVNLPVTTGNTTPAEQVKPAAEPVVIPPAQPIPIKASISRLDSILWPTMSGAQPTLTFNGKPIARTSVPPAFNTTLGEQYVRASARLLKEAPDGDKRQACLDGLAVAAATSPDEVRAALEFKFAKSKHPISDYETELAKTLGVAEAASYFGNMEALASVMRAKATPQVSVVSGTFAGGGVAEMFQTQGHILREFGVKMEWQKTWSPDQRYGETCRKAFDAFQGGSSVIEDADHIHWQNNNTLLTQVYRGLAIDESTGAIYLEDHHPVHMIPPLKRMNGQKRLIWRSHVDMAGVLEGREAGLQVWQRAILPNLELLKRNDIALFQPGSVPSDARELDCPVFVAPPGIDPLSKKNQRISMEDATVILKRVAPDVDPTRPHLVAGGRFVPWKGLIPVVRAFMKVANDFPEVDLLLFGNVGSDDWRKVAYAEQLKTLLAEDPALGKRIKVVLNKNEELAAFYRLAAQSKLPFCQLSLREGHGLMADEASCQGAVSTTTFQGGLGRYRWVRAIARFCVDIADLAKQIVEPTHMYKIEHGKLVPTELADAIENRYAERFRDIFNSRRNNPSHAALYDEAARQAHDMTLKGSLVGMAGNYMAASVASDEQLERASERIGDTGAAPMSAIADVIHEDRAAYKARRAAAQ